MSLPDSRNEREGLKFVETSDGKVALRIKLHDDSFILLDARYVLAAGDTMTGALVISPSTGNKAIVIKKDCKWFFDG